MIHDVFIYNASLMDQIVRLKYYWSYRNKFKKLDGNERKKQKNI